MRINGGKGIPLNRPRPKMGPRNYKTYRIFAPTTYRQATCKEIGCYGYTNGWVMQKERMSADQIWAVTHSGRSFKEVHTAPGQTLLVFEAGQTCFKSIDDEHRVPTQAADELFIAGQGDHRLFNPRIARRHTRPEFWVEDMKEQLDKNNTLMQRG